MSNISGNQEIAIDNKNCLRQIKRIIDLSQNNFHLVLAISNYGFQREEIKISLQEQYSERLAILKLEPSTESLYRMIEQKLAQRQETPDAVMVMGLVTVRNLDEVLIASNQIREQFRNFSCPLILWVTDKELAKFIRLVPDLYSWATTVQFQVETPRLIEFIQATIEQLFAKVLSTRENTFLNSKALNLDINSPRYQELTYAREELRERSVGLEREIRAGLEFVLGRISDNFQEDALHHYENSMELYRRTPNLVRLGHVLYYLGMWWVNRAVRHQPESERAFKKAANYFRRSIIVFERRAGRQDLVAKFINFWAATFHRLEKWDELETVCRKALTLYKSYPDKFREARIYGFLAEIEGGRAKEQTAQKNVPSAKSHWLEERRYANQSLKLLGEGKAEFKNPGKAEREFLEWEEHFHQSWYLFSLGEAERNLGEIPFAIAKLEGAKAIAEPADDPKLYIKILQNLRDSYYQNQEYWQAFLIKQERQKVENQYGFQAFIGASRLEAKHEITNTLLPSPERELTIAKEITYSERIKDVENLVERITNNKQKKLTVIYGQSGVGKSSLLEAGLVPELKQKRVDLRRIKPILQRVYKDWYWEVYKKLYKNQEKAGFEAAIEASKPNIETGKLEPTSEIIDFLFTKIKKNNFRFHVFIFDQFEEFFIDSKEWERKLFYQFLLRCLDPASSYVRVILSLREDYLHYLLEFQRYLEDIRSPERQARKDEKDEYILGRDNLYYLSDFSAEAARSLIEGLNQYANFKLEDALISRLIQDLTSSTSSGKVRPIELQVVGAQLQKKKIMTLKQYEDLGKCPKVELVNQYLTEIVEDCGSEGENRDIAELILYLLTDEQNGQLIRPIKSDEQLKKDLKMLAEYIEEKSAKFKLVLDIFVKSGLVLLIREFPANRYQLVHDYLVSFIRQRKGDKIITELEDAKNKQRKTEEKLLDSLKKEIQAKESILKLRKKQLYGGLAVLLGFSILIAAAVYMQQSVIQIAKLNFKYEILKSKKQLESLQTILDASERIPFTPKLPFFGRLSVSNPPLSWFFLNDVKNMEKETLSHLWEAIYFTQERNQIKAYEQAAIALDVNPIGGSTIVSLDSQGNLKLWDRNLEKSIPIKLNKNNTLNVDSNFSQLKFSPDGQKIAYLEYLIDNNCTIYLYVWGVNKKEIASPQNLKCQDDQVTATSLRFNENSSSLKVFIGKENGEIQIWSWQLSNNLAKEPCNTINDSKATLPPKMEGHKILSISSSLNNKLLVSSHQDKTLKFWQLNKEGSFTYVNSIDSCKKEDRSKCTTINKISFSQNGQWIATASAASEGSTVKPKIKLFKQNSSNGNLYEQYELFKFKPESSDNQSSGFRYLSFIPSPDSQAPVIVATRENGRIELYNSGGDLIATLDGHIGAVYQVSSFSKHSPEEPTYLYSSGDDRTIRMWKLDGILSPTQVISSPQEKLLGQGSSFDPLGKYLAAATGIKGASAKEPQWIKLWQVDRGIYRSAKELARKHTDRINSISFSKNGEYIASAGVDGNVFIWKDYDCYALLNVADFNCDRTNNNATHDDEVLSVVFNPRNDGIIATASKDGTVKVWSKIGNSKYQFNELRDGGSKAHEDKVNSLSFSSDGQFIVTASSDKTVKVWDLKNLNNVQLVEKFKNPEQQFLAVSFQDNNLIVASTNQGLIKFWRHQDKFWEEIPINPPVGLGHDGPIYSIDFSPDADGQYFASASADGTVKLWRKDGTYLTTFNLGIGTYVESVMFRPRSTELVAIDSNNRVTTWNLKSYGLKQLDKNALINLACEDLSSYLNNQDNTNKNEVKKLCQ